jgi:hypothetical protein
MKSGSTTYTHHHLMRFASRLSEASRCFHQKQPNIPTSRRQQAVTYVQSRIHSLVRLTGEKKQPTALDVSCSYMVAQDRPKRILVQQLVGIPQCHVSAAMQGIKG